MASTTLVKIPQTPKGEFAWVTITGKGKPNMNGIMQYKVDLIFEPKGKNAEQDAFVDSIEAFWEANKPANFKKKPTSIGVYPCDPILDEEGNPTVNEDGEKIYDPNGRRALRFKTATTFPDGKTKKVKTFNAKAKEVHLGDTLIGNGSEGRVAGAMDIYVGKTPQGQIVNAGVSLYLDKIMITKLVEYGGENTFEADDDGEFEEVENEFTGEEANTASETAKPRL